MPEVREVREVREVTRDEPHLLRDFLAVPAVVGKDAEGADDGAAAAILAGRHPLNRHCSVRAFVAYAGATPVARLLLTRYPDERTLYLGFFASVDDETASGALFDAAEGAARSAGAAAIVGPVDASFWLRYRLKVDGFANPPYFSEPTNPPYYLRLFEAAGYAVSDRYVSHVFPGAPPGHDFSSFETQLSRLQDRRVTIRSPHWWQWDRTLREIHGLLHELYRDFPVFRPLPYPDFRAVFRGFRLITDLSMVRVAHHDGAAVGFLVAVPDYGTALTTGTVLSRALTIARHRRRSDRYVLLYLGARPGYGGLGAALTGLLAREVVRRGAGAVGALIHEGKATERYASELVGARSTYALLRKEV